MGVDGACYLHPEQCLGTATAAAIAQADCDWCVICCSMHVPHVMCLQVDHCVRLEQQAALLDPALSSRQYNRLHPRYALSVRI